MTRRIATMIHHIVTLCNPEELGSTKLAKALWFADVEYYRQNGQTITRSDDYRKNEQGPLHREFYTAISLLKASGCLSTQTNFTPVGPRNEFFAQTLPDLSDFSAEEIATMDRVVARIRPMSAKAISNETHDALWDEALWNERIPVAAASVLEADITPDLEAWASVELAKDEHRTTT